MSQTANSDRQRRFKELEFAERERHKCNRIFPDNKKGPFIFYDIVAQEGEVHI